MTHWQKGEKIAFCCLRTVTLQQLFYYSFDLYFLLFSISMMTFSPSCGSSFLLLIRLFFSVTDSFSHFLVCSSLCILFPKLWFIGWIFWKMKNDFRNSWLLRYDSFFEKVVEMTLEERLIISTIEKAIKYDTGCCNSVFLLLIQCTCWNKF